MIEYGYINEYGYLTSKIVEDTVERYSNEKGAVASRTATVEMQTVDLLKNGWKPLLPIDASRLKCEDGYCIRIIPYDAGDAIDYKYEKIFDT